MSLEILRGVQLHHSTGCNKKTSEFFSRYRTVSCFVKERHKILKTFVAAGYYAGASENLLKGLDVGGKLDFVVLNLICET